MNKEKREVHICPILMRTVTFKGGLCIEDCSKEDCPFEMTTAQTGDKA